MKNLKKFVAVFIAVTMLVLVIAGCGAQTGDGTATSTSTSGDAVAADTSEESTTPPDPLADPMEISLALWDCGQAVTDQPDAVRDEIYKRLNITIKTVNTTWEDYTQKIQVWAASDQLPDIFAIDAVNTNNLKNWIEQGIVQPMPDDLSPYPDLGKRMSVSGMEIYKYPVNDPAGKFYGIPRLNSFSADNWAVGVGMWLRKDWMANVGITKEPENMDEFITLMKAFVNDDPDKNNKKDTAGLTCYNADWLTWFFSAYEPGMLGGANNWIRDAANPGKWIPAFMSPNTLEGLKALKLLYDTGGLDKDFAVLKAEEGQDKFASSKAGAYTHDNSPGTLQYMNNKFVKNHPDKKFEDVITLLKPFKNVHDGQYYRYIANPAWSETYINAKVDAGKVDRVMRLFDFYISEDGYNLTHFGIEGVDWHKEGDQIIRTPKVDESGAEISITAAYPITKISFLGEWSGTRQYTDPSTTPLLQKMSHEFYDWIIANAQPIPVDLRIPQFDIPDKDKVVTGKFFAEMAIQCIMSKDIDKTWNDIVKSKRADGYDKIIEETNAECARLGIK